MVVKIGSMFLLPKMTVTFLINYIYLPLRLGTAPNISQRFHNHLTETNVTNNHQDNISVL